MILLWKWHMRTCMSYFILFNKFCFIYQPNASSTFYTDIVHAGSVQFIQRESQKLKIKNKMLKYKILENRIGKGHMHLLSTTHLCSKGDNLPSHAYEALHFDFEENIVIFFLKIFIKIWHFLKYLYIFN